MKVITLVGDGLKKYTKRLLNRLQKLMDLFKGNRSKARMVVLRFLAFLKNHYVALIAVTVVLIFGRFWWEMIFSLMGAAREQFAEIVKAGFDPEAQSAGEAATNVISLRDRAYSLGMTFTGLGALLAAPLLLIKIWVNERQARTAEQGHITDRITKAVEQLGAEKTVKKVENGKTVEFTEPNLEVRLGALYALERIAQDSERDHIPIMETLCAYIRENSNARKPTEVVAGFWEKAHNGTLKDWRKHTPPPRADIQAALRIIGRRREARRLHERLINNNYHLDLRGANLQLADLSRADLAFARMQNCRLECADLSSVQMQNADLSEAQMQNVNLLEAQLQGANLVRVQMQKSKLIGVQLQNASLYEAQLQGASLREAQLQNTFLEGAQMQHARLIGAQMQNANLTKAQMQHVSFGAAQMQNARLIEAQIQGANLRGAQMQKANARAADFSKVANMTQEQANSLFGDHHTILPELSEGVRRTDVMDRVSMEYFRDYDPEYHAWLKAGAPPGKPLENS